MTEPVVGQRIHASFPVEQYAHYHGVLLEITDAGYRFEEDSGAIVWIPRHQPGLLLEAEKGESTNG